MAVSETTNLRESRVFNGVYSLNMELSADFPSTSADSAV